MQSILNRWSSVFAVGLCVFLGAAGSSLLRAQSEAGTTTLAGSVVAKDGQAIPGAAVVVKNEATGFSRSTTANDSGRFSATGVPAGVYTVDVSAPGFASTRREGVQVTTGGTQDLSISLGVANVSQAVTVEANVSLATQAAPSQSTLDARTAQSIIGPTFIDNFISPIGDFTEVTQMAPGTFSVNPNGVGLGDSKTFFRGFADGLYTMTFDGIPFNDTNSPTHHSWAFFPSQWIGGTVFDRSPGTAATIGPTNFGGSINLLSRELKPEQIIEGSVSVGSFNTHLYDLSYDSGRFFKNGKSNLYMDVHQMDSDGYQTYNYQQRAAGSAKYQYSFTPKIILSVFSGVIDLHTNTPNTKGPTRAQVAQYGDNYLLSNNPAKSDYYGYNFYHVASDFEYIGLKADLGHGWNVDNKVYTYRYWNQQNYNGTTISATSATDKLNGYRKVGDLVQVSQTSKWGTFRTGMWYEYAWTNRYQIPSDPRTWKDTVLPNFHEKFNTTTVQPYAEYEFRVTRRLTITPGVKLGYYKMDLTQYTDNGKTVGNLGGRPFVQHAAEYHAWQPSFDANYRLKQNWSVYAQYATGNVIPPSSVFDVKNAAVAVLPKPTQARTYQGGTVLKFNRVTLDVDLYRTHFENPYSTTPDPTTGEPVYYATGASVSKGAEAESTILVGWGFSVYVNGTKGSARYVNTGLWVQNAPRDTETIGLTYMHKNWDLGFFNKRVGQMWNDNGSTNQGVEINPFNITNLFFNYTIRSESRFKDSKIRLSLNNLLDRHSIVGVNPASTATSAAAPGDILTLLPGRSIMVSFTCGFSPRK